MEPKTKEDFYRVYSGKLALLAEALDKNSNGQENSENENKVNQLLALDDKLFKEIDVLIGPTMPNVAPKIGVTKGEAMFGELADILAEPSSISGLPAISVPCGLVDGLPVGLQIIGNKFEEGKILNVAFSYEQNK